MKSYLIHLIRHGMTLANTEGAYIGTSDIPLSPEGIRKLQDLKRNFDYPQAQAYFSSPLSRCVDTLRILYPQASPVLVSGLAECSFGEWDGKKVSELQKDERFRTWIAAGGVTAPPGGESGAEFQQRCCGAFSRLIEGLMRSGTTSAVVVTHGGVIRSLLAAFGLPRANFYDWMTANGHGYTLRITPSLWMSGQVFEVIRMLPDPGEAEKDGDQKLVIDLALEAADRAYGKKDPDGEK